MVTWAPGSQIWAGHTVLGVNTFYVHCIHIVAQQMVGAVTESRKWHFFRCGFCDFSWLQEGAIGLPSDIQV